MDKQFLPQRKNKWNEEEDAIIIGNYGIISYLEISKILKVKESTVAHRAKFLFKNGKIPKEKYFYKIYSEKEDSFIIKNIEKLPAVKIGEALGLSKIQIRTRILFLRSSGKLKSLEELRLKKQERENFIQKFLLENYDKLSLNQISKEINESRPALLKHVALLSDKGLIKIKELPERWSEKDEQFLLESTETDQAIAKILNRTYDSVRLRRGYLRKYGKSNFEKGIFSNEEKDFIKNNFYELGAMQCSVKLNRPISIIDYWAKKMSLSVRDDIKFNNADISCILEMKDPFVIYFLGYFWADGTIRHKNKKRLKFKIVKKDFDDLMPFIDRLGSFWNYHEYEPSKKKKNNKRVSVLEVSHPKLWNFFSSFDYGTKSGSSACKILDAIPEELKHYWWRGYFDGDGCLYKGCFKFISCFNQDWSFLKQLETEIDVNFTLRQITTENGKSSTASITHNAFLRRMIKYIYDGEVFGLKRKREKCIFYMENYKTKKIKNNGSRYIGVMRSFSGKKWVAKITFNGKQKIKTFEIEIDAALEYDRLAKEYFGNKATLNFPDAK